MDCERMVITTNLENSASFEANSIIRMENVTAGYRGKTILHNISFDMPKGSCWAIIGPSGAGKTTLFKLITGLLSPKSGTVEILDTDLSKNHKKGWKEIKGKVGYIPQNLGLVKNMDVKTNILLGALGRTSLLPSLFGMMTVDDHRKADEIMKQVGIEHLKNNSVKTLSGGEKRRVAIARALLHGPEVLVADELLSELDGISAENVSRQIKKLQEENGTSIILIEHNIEAARALADTLIVLSEGQIVAIVDSNDTDHYNQVRTLLAHD